MAHYALLDEKNIVVDVITGVDDGNVDWESYYGQIHNLRCRRTSYNTYAGAHSLGGIPFRKNYAAIGYVYDEARDAFRPVQPFKSWALNEQTCFWEPPVPVPDTNYAYRWDEENLRWVKE